jgi:hypothetical protein
MKPAMSRRSIGLVVEYLSYVFPVGTTAVALVTATRA